MQLDPSLAAVATALSAVAGLLYRSLLQRAERAEKAALFWQERYLASMGLAGMALDEAERRKDS